MPYIGCSLLFNNCNKCNITGCITFQRQLNADNEYNIEHGFTRYLTTCPTNCGACLYGKCLSCNLTYSLQDGECYENVINNCVFVVNGKCVEYFGNYSHQNNMSSIIIRLQ